jgi:cell division septum initiation protein DivIVA
MENEMLKTQIEKLKKQNDSLINSIISACTSVKDDKGKMPLNAHEMAKEIRSLRRKNERLVSKSKRKA